MADKKISQLTAATTPLAGTEVLPIVQSSSTDKVSVANLTAGRAVSGLSFTAAGANTYNVINNTSASPGSNASPSYAGMQFLGYAGALKAQIDGGDCSNSSYRGVYRIQTCDDGGQNMATRMQFNGDADITWYTVNLVQGTAAKGINFTANTPAAGKTSQLLNWYEEGTWTPTQGGGLTVVGSFSSAGVYTRIGRQVTVIAKLGGSTSIAVSASGILLTNLPFAATGNICLGQVTDNNAATGTSCGILTTAATNTLYALEARVATPFIFVQITYFV